MPKKPRLGRALLGAKNVSADLVRSQLASTSTANDQPDSGRLTWMGDGMRWRLAS